MELDADLDPDPHYNVCRSEALNTIFSASRKQKI